MYLEFIILKYADKKSNRHVILLQSKLTLISNGPQRRQTMLPKEPDQELNAFIKMMFNIPFIT